MKSTPTCLKGALINAAVLLVVMNEQSRLLCSDLFHIPYIQKTVSSVSYSIENGEVKSARLRKRKKEFLHFELQIHLFRKGLSILYSSDDTGNSPV